MHIPVLLKEMLQYLDPKEGGVYVDATFGGGGYTSAILDHANCTVIAVDRDPDAIARAHVLKSKYNDRLIIVESNFKDMHIPLKQHAPEGVDGIVFDFGVSSFQLDEAERGFSFMRDGPLDMRMSKDGQSAEDIVNTLSEKDLAAIIYHYGDEPFSRSIAKAIVQDRPFHTTLRLANLIRRIVKRKDSIDPATKTFQALRIFVNNELIEIRDALNNSLNNLKINAHLVGVTFHSLEDRLLKRFLIDSEFEIIAKLITPSESELFLNPRSRSAKLRAGIYLGEAK